MPEPEVLAAYEGRITEDYIVSQVNGFRQQKSHTDHKREISDFDKAYGGDLTSLFPDETSLPNVPLVENRLKNATHDIARLSAEARGVPIFMKEKEGKEGAKKSALRGVIAQTLWEKMAGRRKERKLYMDAIAAGYMALAVFYNEKSDYPQALRLNPRNCYPDFRNGQLQTMLHVETLKEREAAFLFPEFGLDSSASNAKRMTLVTLYTDEEVVVALCNETASGKSKNARVISRWEHELGCVPVAFETLDTADDSYHGVLYQLMGPLMARNKSARLILDYLESMAHAPFEAKNIMNADEEPGAETIYEHDPNADESFMRRVQPASQSGMVSYFMQYLDQQEQAEAIQPPSRVGQVRQSIASGTFVESTQGTLSSLVLELQDMMSSLRYQVNCLAFAVDSKHLNKEKPLIRAVGSKHMYTPKTDMGDFYYHKVEYGAGAGVSRAEAANRVQLDMGAGLISKETARSQVDYIDDVTVEQDRIDRENLANVFFQRFSTDPNTKMSLIARSIVEMGKGKTLLETMTELAPEFLQAEEKPAEGAPANGEMQGVQGTADQPNPEEEQASLEAGGQLDIGGFQPPPMQQQIVRNAY